MTMKITDLEVFILRGPESERPHWVSNFIVPTANEILIRLKTNDGVEGFGMATSYTNAEPVLDVFRSGIGEHIIGANPLAPERLYKNLFSLTSARLAHEKGAWQWRRHGLFIPRRCGARRPPPPDPWAALR